MHFRCVSTMLNCCVLVGLDWAEPMIFFKFACHMFMHFHTYILTFNSLYSFILFCQCFSDCLSLPLSLSYIKFALWHPNTNPLHPRTLFVLGHQLLLLTLLLLTYGSVMIKLERTFQRTFLDEAFIRNANVTPQTPKGPKHEKDVSKYLQIFPF